MTFPTQLTFGEFIAASVGPKWVYAQRTSARLKSRYPGSAVILPKQQKELAAAYKKEWGSEYDPASWKALCALRAMLTDYRSDGCSDKDCLVCRRSNAAKTMAREALAALTSCPATCSHATPMPRA